MASVHDIGIYGNGLFQETLFQTTPVSYQEQLDQLAPAGFTWLVLWAWHVLPNGDIHYNTVPAVQNGQLVVGEGGLNPDLPALLGQLRELSSIRRVGLSLGGDQTTFESNIMRNLETVMDGLGQLVAFLSIDSIDFDFEPFEFLPKYETTIVTVTNRVADMGLAVTYCPSNNVSFYAKCAAAVRQQRGDQPVAGINAQLYGDTEGVAGKEWLDTLETIDTGMDPRSFLVPGLWVQNTRPRQLGQCPSSIQSTFASYAGDGLVNGWLYNAGWVFEQSLQNSLCPDEGVTLADYAGAILNGLEPKQD